jgi:hypothetical protein
MSTNRYLMPTAVLPDGNVVFLGGWERDTSVSVNAVLVYTPASP